jgi:hypothetical protein
VIQQWEDWISEDWKTELVEPVFSAVERAAIAEFGLTWKAVVEKTPDPLPDLASMLEREEWKQLREAAKTLLMVFNERGKLSEEVEDV